MSREETREEMYQVERERKREREDRMTEGKIFFKKLEKETETCDFSGVSNS